MAEPFRFDIHAGPTDNQTSVRPGTVVFNAFGVCVLGCLFHRVLTNPATKIRVLTNPATKNRVRELKVDGPAYMVSDVVHVLDVAPQ